MRDFFGRTVNWLGGAIEDVGGVVESATTFVAGLPNELVDLADRIAAGQARASEGARREATEFQTRRLFGEYGPFIVIGGLALAVWALASK